MFRLGESARTREDSKQREQNYEREAIGVRPSP
jgi:hypothetical protein